MESLGFVVTVAALSAIMAGGGAWEFQNSRFEAKELARKAAEAELAASNQAAIDTASTSHTAAKAKINTKYLVVTEEIENVVTKIEYRDRICLDADGLRAHASAVELTGATRKSERALPAADIP
jgi:uncharacterized protein YlzI (FlbEa/FlbD family)